MRREDIVHEYLDALQNSDYEKITSLFTEDAVVKSPLYGEMKAREFYRILFKETLSSRIDVIHICTRKGYAMAYFTYEWTVEDGSIHNFDCVDVFRFSEKGKIKELSIVYDTHVVRKSGLDNS